MDQAVKNATLLRDRMKERISNLKAERQRIEEQLGYAEQELANVQIFLDVHSQYASLIIDGVVDDDDAARVPKVQQDAPSQKGVARKRPKNPDREYVAEAAYETIKGVGAPISRADLFDMLALQGIIIQGKDPQMVLSTMLWRSQDKIVRLEGHGYWLADQPYLPASYAPKSGLFD